MKKNDGGITLKIVYAVLILLLMAVTIVGDFIIFGKLDQGAQVKGP